MELLRKHRILADAGRFADRLSIAKRLSRRTSLTREHALYQSDWLMRFDGYGQDEIIAGDDVAMQQSSGF